MLVNGVSLKNGELYMGFITDGIGPEDQSVNPFLTDPTLLRMLCEHVPLTRAGNIFFMTDPSGENEFVLVRASGSLVSMVHYLFTGLEYLS